MFLDEIRSHLCQCSNDPSGTHFYAPFRVRSIRCGRCAHTLDVYDLISNASSLDAGKDPFLSARLGYAFAEWSGDVHVPCEFLVKIETGKILPTRVRHTPLSHLLKGIKILKALNHPFAEPNAPPPDKKIFQMLVDEYISLMDKVCSSDEADNNQNGEFLALKLILQNIKAVFTKVNFFEQYFDILVPYVKSRAGEPWQEAIPVFPEDNVKSPGLNLYQEIVKSDAVRHIFSKYCVAFDVVYVMALCFICGDDTDLLYNLVCDLAARLCTRYFYIPDASETDRLVARFLNSHSTPTKNIQFYYLVRQFRQQGLEDYLSDDFIKKYGSLELATKNAFRIDDSHTLNKFKHAQSFPYILFDGRDEDYYGFVMALAFYASKTTAANGIAPKGLISNCKRIYRFVKHCILRVRDFEGGQTPVDVYWTKDTLHLFLCTDAHFEKEMIAMVGMMLSDASQNESRVSGGG